MFGKIKKFLENNAGWISILAPINGDLIPITKVSDPTFSEEMLGKGVAILPTEGRVVSPVSGTVTQLFDTYHAISLTSDDGVEILIHVGMDTLRLKGAHYTPHVKDGDSVKLGDLLLEFDMNAIIDAGFDVVTPVVICNSDEYPHFEAQLCKIVEKGDEIIRLKK